MLSDLGTLRVFLRISVSIQSFAFNGAYYFLLECVPYGLNSNSEKKGRERKKTKTNIEVRFLKKNYE